jgi:tartrate dehydratase alpha subunit/fumarate hydratase class I-like protein
MDTPIPSFNPISLSPRKIIQDAVEQAIAAIEPMIAAEVQRQLAEALAAQTKPGAKPTKEA